MQKDYGWGLPLNASAHGAEIDRLIYVVHVFMALLFVGWLVFLITALIRFRSRPGHQAAYKAHHFKAPTYLEVVIALVEAVLLVGFSFPVFYHVRKALPPDSQSLHVRIAAEQFAWNVHYPGEDGIFGRTDVHLMSAMNPLGLDTSDPHAQDDITSINQLHIPVNKPIIVNLTSKDVIHSFFIPVMRVKQDVVPGQVIPVWFEAIKMGNFEIACAQLCGLGHYRMRGYFTVETEEQFKAWLAQMKPPAPAPRPPLPPAAAPPPVPTLAASTGPQV